MNRITGKSESGRYSIITENANYKADTVIYSQVITGQNPMKTTTKSGMILLILQI